MKMRWRFRSQKSPYLSGEMIAQDEEDSCDGEETSSRMMVEKKPKLSSGHRGNISQWGEEDGYSDKTPPSMDDIEMTEQDEDGQHSEKIGVHDDTEENKREQGRARVHAAQALLDADDETISKKISYFLELLTNDGNSPEHEYCPEYEPEELIELYERLALYRIRAYESIVHRKLAALNDVDLKLQYPSSKLYDEGFYKYYEESLEWYFDPELCKDAHFDDYRRMTLRSFGKYLDWERYHSTLNTYEQDMAYVQYCEVLANETKWIEDYMRDSTHRRNRIQDVVYIQALEIAVDFPNVSLLLVSLVPGMEFDRSHKGLDGLYFKIWKRVAKGKYDAHVAGIDKTASDDKARELITEAVTELFPRDRYYLDYARKKLDIGRRREVAPQHNGENGEEKASLEMGK